VVLQFRAVSVAGRGMSQAAAQPDWAPERELPAPPAPAPAGRLCSCGHVKQAHQHYRRGTDCSACACLRYSRPLLRRLFSRGR
jgi:hypothetical protein